MKVGRLIGAFLVVLFSGLMGPVPAQAEFIVTSVIREFPMKSGETMHHDFYINAGSNNGLRKGAYVDAVRKMPAYDNINSKMLGDFPVRIARLHLIFVDKNVSVGRLVEFYDKKTTPLAGVDAVMIGDYVEVSERQ